jgi:chemotaxis protein methyltransferase CheR
MHLCRYHLFLTLEIKLLQRCEMGLETGRKAIQCSNGRMVDLSTGSINIAANRPNAKMTNNRASTPNYIHFTMSDAVFRQLSDFIYEKCGVNLGPVKKTMLTARLSKRLRALGMPSFREYFDYVRNSKGQSDELVRMINTVTTNKTDFFREPQHFDFMTSTALPDLVRSGRGLSSRRINIWSAGCSSGEEPYTIAMVLLEFFQAQGGGESSILATDISTRVLAVAERGIYPEAQVGPVPPQLKRKYLMRGKGAQEGFCRVVPELRKLVRFRRLNLIEGGNFGLRMGVDVIFCRNVIIYFDRKTQIKLFQKFYNQLERGGYLFIGHSETLQGINDRFVPVGNAIYRKMTE